MEHSFHGTGTPYVPSTKVRERMFGRKEEEAEEKAAAAASRRRLAAEFARRWSSYLPYAPSWLVRMLTDGSYGLANICQLCHEDFTVYHCRCALLCLGCASVAYARGHDDDDDDDDDDVDDDVDDVDKAVVGRCHVCGKKPDLLLELS